MVSLSIGKEQEAVCIKHSRPAHPQLRGAFGWQLGAVVGMSHAEELGCGIGRHLY